MTVKTCPNYCSRCKVPTELPPGIVYVDKNRGINAKYYEHVQGLDYDGDFVQILCSGRAIRYAAKEVPGGER
jgi:hypothetical protein